ncbi:helix-turn-helix domain-containing protein [Candidatus Dependentiae bacterium]|nr:helix-turn-helix domain-containing protein [Candidatus Dependentiae bacterium]
MTIGERIRLARQSKNLSQTELSQLSGVAYKSLSRYELGFTIPPADAIKAIADALNITTDYLLGNEVVKIKDKELFKKFEVIQEMKGDMKNMIYNFLDLAIRDYKAKQVFTQ